MTIGFEPVSERETGHSLQSSFQNGMSPSSISGAELSGGLVLCSSLPFPFFISRYPKRMERVKLGRIRMEAVEREVLRRKWMARIKTVSIPYVRKGLGLLTERKADSPSE